MKLKKKSIKKRKKKPESTRYTRNPGHETRITQ
jgi:hypothetical protein